jgi:4-carboxymuconolactone decarboxylase
MSDRSETGVRVFEEVLGKPARPARTPVAEAARDFLFAEVWSRPGLDRRSRFWITLTCAAAAGSTFAMRTYLIAALDTGVVTEAELREFALQFAAYQGFPKAATFEVLLSEILAERAKK